jgi:hypothetical protein
MKLIKLRLDGLPLPKYLPGVGERSLLLFAYIGWYQPKGKFFLQFVGIDDDEVDDDDVHQN